ncbi:peptidase, S8A (subtilisin) subfamily protein [Plesiocystis pacifica SIR-1]|uniref:Peptidase, S8A (Subtilisin) subfamily protein n=1 Tax=Plesiocystis pacifica SIR-1 TaxID=391625 RepID=A6GBM9_9BACT|nr:S8 family peptidase [Plesiocystis pacifica]EDM76735.1 peptidase, S8A (subtilisin) subfamily protein [Plesiocystis pacifica SIR-1]
MKRRSNAPTVLAGTALFGLSCLLAWQHHDRDEGLSAAAIDEATIAQELEAGQDGRQLLLDLVEPERGEGGSEAQLAELMAAIDAIPGLTAEPAGFYSETEHLWRVHGTPQALQRFQDELRSGDHALSQYAELIEGMEADVSYSLPDDALVAVTGELGELDDDADIAKPRRPRFEPNDPMYPLQWHLDAINTPEAWTHTRGKGATVAVIDTGVAWKDLRWKNVDARAVPDLAGIEFVHGETFVNNGLPEGLDDHAHGTHVAGTIAQATDNRIGVAGVAHQAKIMPLKVLGASGGGSVASIANAIRYAADNDADVINMSLGGPLPSRVMAKAVLYAHEKGVTVVCAAGNEKRSRVSYPAAYEGSVAVAATDWSGKRTFYSNWGKQLDISAPGGDTRSDKNGDGHPDGVLQNTIRIQDPSRNDYLWFQGTSMASPHAAGVAGLVVASGVTNPKEVERIMKNTAVHPNKKNWDREYGAGIIDAEKAVLAAKGKAQGNSLVGYRGERIGFAGLLALLGFAGLGFAGVATGLGAGPGSSVGRKLGAGLGLAAGAGLAVGAFTTPLAYAAGTATTWIGSGLFLSALIPLLLTLTLLQVERLRGLLAGLSLGWAAILVHGAVVLPTLMEGIPGGAGWDRLWLAGNAVLALWLARRTVAAGQPEERPALEA